MPIEARACGIAIRFFAATCTAFFQNFNAVHDCCNNEFVNELTNVFTKEKDKLMKFHLAMIGLLLIAIVTLGACGGGSSSSPSSPANQSQPGETVINGKA